MKKNIVLTTLVLILMTTVVLTVPTVFAGNKNQNGEHGIQGTGKLNGKDGCAAPAQSGNYMVYMPLEHEIDDINAMLSGMEPPLPPLDSIEWAGGPCCPSNIPSDGFTFWNDNQYPLLNQCCNGPDMGPPDSGVPGNHCLCFTLRGYPIPEALDW